MGRRRRKIGLVPLASFSTEDALARLVVHRDVNLSGQFEVIDEANAPPGPYTRTSALDLRAWRKKEAEYVMRVYGSTSGGKVQLTGEVYETPSKDEANKPDDPNAPPPEPPQPMQVVKIESQPPESARTACHRLVDKLLEALTGTAGSFTSQMVYTGRVGRWRQVFVIDADGFNLHPYGPSDATTLSPQFGPYGEIYYSISQDFHRYKIVYGPKSTAAGVTAPGSIMSFAFSANKQKIAYDVFEDGDSKIYLKAVGDAAAQVVSKEPFANHPVFGPGNLFAYLAGKYAQRVYVNGKPISPNGAWASAPVVCDTPQGPKSSTPWVSAAGPTSS